MVSFDVTALYTSISPKLAIETMQQLLYSDENTKTQLSTWIELIKLCLTTYFQFNTQIYEQIKGTPMGSPISGLIAEAVMQRLELIALPIIKPKIWIRYVDDTFVIIKRNDLEYTHKLINNIFEDIKFTREEELDNKIPFLDVLIRRTNTGDLETQVYRKSTHTDQILNYTSNNPVTHKRNCVQTLFKRVQTHCSTPELKRMEEKYLQTVFKKNGYPQNFIKKCLKSNQNTNKKPSSKTTRKFILPYMRNISEITARVLKPFDIDIAHKPVKSLNSILCKPKDPTEKGDKINTIYKINCMNCNKHYIGQSGRPLRIRIQEHKSAVKRHDMNSLVSMHADNYGHQFDWDHVKILNRGNTKSAREFLEAWYSSENAINKHINIDEVYQLIKSKSGDQKV
ncbi:unnamed protein product [Trichobilharzia szidati]|nr:unnamed protein product [Trichobilharzia szidati]